MSFNKIYSGMENAPQAIDENFNNSYPKDEILTEETAAALGVTEDNPTPEMAFKKITEGATGIAMLSKPDATNWDSGTHPQKSGKFNLVFPDGFSFEYDHRSWWRLESGYLSFAIYGRLAGSSNSTTVFSISALPESCEPYQAGAVILGRLRELTTNIMVGGSEIRLPNLEGAYVTEKDVSDLIAKYSGVISIILTANVKVQ